jgi:uncharacterized protein YndB with AHSA1/START domain
MSESDHPGTREQEHSIEIDAPPEAVWRAITEAEEVIRWYVQSAEIDPRVGGTYKVSWGEGMDGVSEIVTFEPGRHFRIEHRPMPGSPPFETGPIAEEYFIETRGGKTVLRLVTSGIPDTDDWDAFYEGTKRGWTIFLMSLRHYLERHAGTPRDQIVSMVGLPGSCADAWPVLMGDDGLGVADTLETATSGARYSGRTAFGQDLAGEVIMLDPPHRFLVTLEDVNDGLLGATLEQMGPQNFLYLSLSTFGLEPAVVEEMRGRWSDWLTGLFPTGAAPAEAFQEMLSDPAATPD